MSWKCRCGFDNDNSSEKCARCNIWSKAEAETQNDLPVSEEVQPRLQEIPRVVGRKEYVMLAPKEAYQKDFDGEALQYMLNKYASEGWRLVSATPMTGLKPMSTSAIFMSALVFNPFLVAAMEYAQGATWTMVFIMERDIE